MLFTCPKYPISKSEFGRLGRFGRLGGRKKSEPRIVIFLPVDQFALQGVIGSITVYANDCDPMAHDLAMKMRIERTYENTKLVPIKSKFKDLYEAMLSEGVEEESLSGIIIGKN